MRRTGLLQAIGCALFALLATAFAMVATQSGPFDPTALVRMAASDPLAAVARQIDPTFHLVTSVEHYDGVYYYAMALDPLALGAAHELIDQAPYRYGHPLHGWLAWILSFGVPGWVPGALMSLGLLGMAAAAFAVSRLALAIGASPWMGLVVPLSPGLLYATTVDTTEPVGVALVAATLLCWHRQRLAWAALLLVLCCLDKEQYVAVPAGLALFEVSIWIRRRSIPPRWRSKALALAAGPAALATWYLWVGSRFGTLPNNYEDGNIGRPFAGWGETFTHAHTLAGSGDFHASQIGATTPAVLAAYACLVLVALIRSLRLQTVVDVPFLLLVAIAACQGWRTLLYPHELLRVQAVLLVLAVVIVLTPGRRVAPAPPPSASPPSPAGGHRVSGDPARFS